MSRFLDTTPRLQERFPELSSNRVTKIVDFAEHLYQANQTQNLTRIEGWTDFVEGHLLDVIELFRWNLELGGNILGRTIMDIGSGSGVPGLLGAAMDDDPMRVWHLVEAEKNKAEYLSETAKKLKLDSVSVHHARAEKAIQSILPDTVMARAVGTVEKIGAWIWDCSTWNNLVLFKSRGWAAEWQEAQKTRIGKNLTVTHVREYSSQNKYRILILLSRK